MSFTQIRRESDGVYVIHATGCAHVKMRSTVWNSSIELPGTDVKDVAQHEAEHNEGCIFSVAPCAGKEHGIKATDRFMSDWTRMELGY